MNSPSLSDVEVLPSSLKAPALGTSISQKDHGAEHKPSSPWPINDLNIPTKTNLPDTEDDARLGNVSLKLQPRPQGNTVTIQAELKLGKNETRPRHDP